MGKFAEGGTTTLSPIQREKVDMHHAPVTVGGGRVGERGSCQGGVLGFVCLNMIPLAACLCSFAVYNVVLRTCRIACRPLCVVRYAEICQACTLAACLGAEPLRDRFSQNGEQRYL